MGQSSKAIFSRGGSVRSPVLRSLVTLHMSQINWCHFCIDINSSTLAKRAGSMDKVEALEKSKESDLFREYLSLIGLLCTRKQSSKRGCFG